MKRLLELLEIVEAPFLTFEERSIAAMEVAYLAQELKITKIKVKEPLEIVVFVCSQYGIKMESL